MLSPSTLWDGYLCWWIKEWAAVKDNFVITASLFNYFSISNPIKPMILSPKSAKNQLFVSFIVFFSLHLDGFDIFHSHTFDHKPKPNTLQINSWNLLKVDINIPIENHHLYLKFLTLNRVNTNWKTTFLLTDYVTCLK